MKEIILDTETTGFDPFKGDRIIEIGCIELVNRMKSGRSFHCYINPERDVPIGAFNVHGISTEFLQDKPLFRDIYQEFFEFVDGADIVIHNAKFDTKFINYEFKLLKKPPLNQSSIIDTLTMARKKFPGSPASLDALCKRFGIKNDHRTLHGALLDAELLAEVYFELTDSGQPRFDLEIEAKKEDNFKNKITRQKQFIEKRNFPISEDEEKLHQEFLQKLKNPVWQE